MACDERKEQPTLALPMDTRSPAGSVGRGAWALVINANCDLSGRVLRLGGWRRFGWQADEDGLWVNQDLHDQLESGVTPAVEECDAATYVDVVQTASYGNGMVAMTFQHDGAEPTRVRWYRNDVLIYDSAA